MATMEMERDLKKSWDNELSALKSDIAAVRTDLRSLVESVLGEARSETKDIAQSARENVRTGVDALESYVEHRPFTTMLVSVGVGLLLGKVFSK